MRSKVISSLLVGCLVLAGCSARTSPTRPSGTGGDDAFSFAERSLAAVNAWN